MENQRTIICDCGGTFVEKTTEIDGIITKAMVCNGCEHTNLTKSQAKEFVRLKELHRIIDKKRKIIKIGNSNGITLPDELNLKAGQMVETEALTPESFVVRLLSKAYKTLK